MQVSSKEWTLVGSEEASTLTIQNTSGYNIWLHFGHVRPNDQQTPGSGIEENVIEAFILKPLSPIERFTLGDKLPYVRVVGMAAAGIATPTIAFLQ